MLSRTSIYDAWLADDIEIKPFNVSNLGPNSYDVRLGNWFWVTRPDITPDSPIDPYHERMSNNSFDGPYSVRDGGTVLLVPGRIYLAHTNEVIGTNRAYVAQMHARSSYERLGLIVCACAGLGDVGYVGRWTMELRVTVPLLLRVGARVAQMTFERLESRYSDNETYHGKYGEQSGRSWSPADMLPQAWRDADTPAPIIGAPFTPLIYRLEP